MSVYKCNVEFSRYFVEGTLEGILTENNKMGFLDWDDAKDWVRAVNHSKNVPYVVVYMTNLETGETIEG